MHFQKNKWVGRPILTQTLHFLEMHGRHGNDIEAHAFPKNVRVSRPRLTQTLHFLEMHGRHGNDQETYAFPKHVELVDLG